MTITQALLHTGGNATPTIMLTDDNREQNQEQIGSDDVFTMSEPCSGIRELSSTMNNGKDTAQLQPPPQRPITHERVPVSRLRSPEEADAQVHTPDSIATSATTSSPSSSAQASDQDPNQEEHEDPASAAAAFREEEAKQFKEITGRDWEMLVATRDGSDDPWDFGDDDEDGDCDEWEWVSVLSDEEAEGGVGM